MNQTAQVRAAIGKEGAGFEEILEKTGLPEFELKRILQAAGNPRHRNHQMNVADREGGKVWILNQKGRRLLERDERLLAEGKEFTGGRPKGAPTRRRRTNGMVGKLFECIADQEGKLVLQSEDGQLLQAQALVLR